MRGCIEWCPSRKAFVAVWTPLSQLCGGGAWEVVSPYPTRTRNRVKHRNHCARRRLQILHKRTSELYTSCARRDTHTQIPRHDVRRFGTSLIRIAEGQGKDKKHKMKSIIRLVGLMVERQTPDLKVGGSNPARALMYKAIARGITGIWGAPICGRNPYRFC